MSQRLNLARIKKFGNNFEISVDPDKALQFKNSEISNLREVLLAENIFTDARKGQVASDDELNKAFQTTDADKIAKIIIEQGEIQVTAEHRSAEREQRRRKLVHLIHQQAVDPTTKFPHPATRIEAALDEAKVHLLDHKTVEEQFQEVVQKLRPILPISIEKAKLTLTIPAQYTGKTYNLVKTAATILKEEWGNDGKWHAIVELPAGLQEELLDKLNSATHGEVVVE
jgi:ribosome maturation protein SDO1